MVMLDWKAEIRQHLGVFKKRKCHHGCSGWGRGAVWPENKIPIWSSRLRCTTITAFWTTLTLGHSHTRTVYSIILDLITVSSGLYSSESAERGWNCILVFLCIDTSGAVFTSGHLINNFTLHFHWRWRRSSYASNNPLFHPVIRLSMHSDSFLCFYVDCTTSAVWQPKNTLINSQPSQRRSHQSPVCVCLCVFLSACYVLCITPVFIVFFFLVLLFVPSVYVCLGVSGCSTSSSSWLFQEMHLIVLGSEVSYLPSGHPPPLTPPVLFFF